MRELLLRRFTRGLIHNNCRHLEHLASHIALVHWLQFIHSSKEATREGSGKGRESVAIAASSIFLGAALCDRFGHEMQPHAAGGPGVSARDDQLAAAIFVNEHRAEPR